MRTVQPTDTALDPTAGNQALILSLAAGLRRAADKDTLSAIHAALRNIVSPDDSYDSPLRGRLLSSDMLAPHSAWGCSARAQVACHLARACGIPAILVKTITPETIKTHSGRANGHVFVEVLCNGKPAMWEPEGGRLRENFDPSRTFVTKQYWIYEKGAPDEVILAHQGKQWEAEIRRLFT